MDKSASQSAQSVNKVQGSSYLSDAKKVPWINAWRDAVIGVKAFSQSIQLCDLRGDGDFKFLVGGMNKKVIAYKGANLDWETQVADTPIAVATFYPETAKIPQPNIAVAAESSIYLFKNLKPYFKFNLPAQELRKEESIIWNQFQPDRLEDFIAGLTELRNNGVPLSSKTNEVLNTVSQEKQLALIEVAKQEPLALQNSATCLEVIKKNSDDEAAISQLVVGTENKQVIILDPTGTSAIRIINIPGVPVFLDISGLLEVDYQIIAITRESRGVLIKNGELKKLMFELESKPCAIAKVDKNIYVGSMDQSIQAFNINTMRRVFSIKMPEYITNMESMEKSQTKSLKAYLVALANMEIRMYNEKQLIYTLKGEDTISGMKYGTFGREDGALVILYNRLGLDVKILQRQFNINSISQSSKDTEPEAAFNMPKKTKLFIEQSQRERDQAPEMYRTYMKDLFKMRLKIAQSYIKGLKEGVTQSSGPGTSHAIRIHAGVDGIGPLFKIKVDIENLDRHPAYGLKLSYAYDSNIYKLHKVPMDLPVLVPGLPYPLEVMVENIDANGSNDTVRVYVMDKDKNVPIVTAVVNMPVSEINVE